MSDKVLTSLSQKIKFDLILIVSFFLILTFIGLYSVLSFLGLVLAFMLTFLAMILFEAYYPVDLSMPRLWKFLKVMIILLTCLSMMTWATEFIFQIIAVD